MINNPSKRVWSRVIMYPSAAGRCFMHAFVDFELTLN